MIQTNIRWVTAGGNRLAFVTDSTQQLHKQDFIELIERARRSGPHPHKPRPPQSGEGGGLVEDPEVSEVMDLIEID